MTILNKIKKWVHFDAEILWGWKGRIFVLAGFNCWLPYKFEPKKASPTGEGTNQIEERLLSAIFGREDGQIQIVIPFIRVTYRWSKYTDIDTGFLFEYGWKDCNADMYKHESPE